MIQRIQSIFLIIGFLINICAGIWLYFANIDRVFVFVSSLLFLISLFSYKNRKVQIRLDYLNIILNLLFIGLLSYYLLNTPGEDFSSEKGVLFIVPAGVIILLFIANNYIKKDDKLVKSVDRFR